MLEYGDFVGFFGVPFRLSKFLASKFRLKLRVYVAAPRNPSHCLIAISLPLYEMELKKVTIRNLLFYLIKKNYALEQCTHHDLTKNN